MKEYTELKRDLWIGIVTIVLGIMLFFTIIYTISDQTFTGINGRAFPYVIDVFLIILGCALAIDSFMQLKKNLHSDKNTNKYEININNILHIFIFFALLCLYVVSIMYIGFVVSSFLFTAILLIFYKLKNKIAFIVITCSCTPILWFVFDKLVGVEFPTALLF